MRIEALEIQNFKVLKDVSIRDIPNMAVFLGKNGVGKSTFFDVFAFLHDCLLSNVKSAILKRGGFHELLSRDGEGDICFKIQFRPSEDEPLITYELAIGQNADGSIIVRSEVLRMRRAQRGAPWKILDFKEGVGVAAEGELRTYEDVQLATRKPQSLGSPDILAIKGLGQFKNFVAVSQFRQLMEDWYIADFRIDAQRERQEATYHERLSSTGDNLAVATKALYDHHPEIFSQVLQKMKERIPGVETVEARMTEDGYIVLRFQDGKFKNPFSAKFVSDGTMKMFTYLILLNDPEKHALLCIDTPESQLHHELLEALAEECRHYALKGQVFVSTHSPVFLNAMSLNEIFVLCKNDGYTRIIHASDNSLASRLFAAGDKPGELWKQGLLEEIHR